MDHGTTIVARMTGPLLATALLVLSLPAAAEPGRLTARGGVMPEGLWVRNRAKSVEIDPGDDTLWVVKDDGKTSVWVSVATDDKGKISVMSYEGAYGGPPSPVKGTPMTTQIVSRAPGTLHNWGRIDGLGPYVEDCAVDAGQKHFTCDGQVTTTAGVRRWHDDFVWAGPSPK
ncbi:hypothetical protein [Sphingomonas bacterium]|uniref:hypothetical protein n=1 Tax=Sphingomonas bacterium TaxID=1895847 RepID=UPI0015759296|nr:hypothetical protein [Sphingomonas bacterium]